MRFCFCTSVARYFEAAVPDIKVELGLVFVTAVSVVTVVVFCCLYELPGEECLGRLDTLL